MPMVDIFISFTGSDRNWALWIGHELETLVAPVIENDGNF
jgi:hypothetical protein